MKRFFAKLFRTILILALIAGVCFLLYPTASDQFNRWQNAQIIQEQGNDADALDQTVVTTMIRAAEVYNRRLLTKGGELTDAFSGEETEAGEEYMSLLNLNGDGVMGVIEIPKISVSLPIYHTVDDLVLETGAGHVEGSSLPVGGLSTHCVLAGHRGLPSARLFTDLDQLEEGDMFTITVLGQKLFYQVDQIKVVEPTNTEETAIVRGKDYVTLVTCTPYGINSHRLLIRGARVQGDEANALVARDDSVTPVPQWASILLFTVPVLIVGWLILAIINRIRRER